MQFVKFNPAQHAKPNNKWLTSEAISHSMATNLVHHSHANYLDEGMRQFSLGEAMGKAFNLKFQNHSDFASIHIHELLAVDAFQICSKWSAVHCLHIS